MRYARIYPWRRTRRFRAPSNGPEAFFVAQFSAGYTTNMFGFDLRQGQEELGSNLLHVGQSTLASSGGRGSWLLDNNELCKSRNEKHACLLEFFIADGRERLQDALYVLLPHLILSSNF